MVTLSFATAKKMRGTASKVLRIYYDELFWVCQTIEVSAADPSPHSLN
jgi:hypothetical protein